MFDPFDALGMEKTFSLNLGVLEKHYFEAQKKVHPDRFALAEGDAKAEALRQSTALNQAYALLRDPLERAAFLLREKGVEPLSHDPLFLSEVMAWNEQLEGGEDIRSNLRLEKNQLLKNLNDAFDKGDDEEARVALYRLTYVKKLLKDLI